MFSALPPKKQQHNNLETAGTVFLCTRGVKISFSKNNVRSALPVTAAVLCCCMYYLCAVCFKKQSPTIYNERALRHSILFAEKSILTTFNVQNVPLKNTLQFIPPVLYKSTRRSTMLLFCTKHNDCSPGGHAKLTNNRKTTKTALLYESSICTTTKKSYHTLPYHTHDTNKAAVFCENSQPDLR